MRDKAMWMVLPSIEEGFGLVCTEALGSGSVPAGLRRAQPISAATWRILWFTVADVAAITEHFNILHDDRDLLQRFRDGVLPLRSGNAPGNCTGVWKRIDRAF